VSVGVAAATQRLKPWGGDRRYWDGSPDAPGFETLADMATTMRIFSSFLFCLVPAVVAAQTLEPGESVGLSCAGEWANLRATATSITADCVETATVNPGAIVVDHASIAQFPNMPPSGAASRRLLFVNRSVGSIINDGVTCLSTPYATARNACKRYLHPVSRFNNQPETWEGTYDRSQWTFLGHSGISPALPCTSGEGALACFVRYVNERQGQFDVVLFMPSYLLETTASAYVTEMLALRARHPHIVVALATSSLPRDNAGLSGFNTAVRRAAADHGFPLLDVAHIEQHDQSGRAWFDNRDGVPYTNGNCVENHPDDGINEPAITPHYTSECFGGHPGNPDVGKIRLAKGVWLLVARIAGWTP
jgi:hypothetical protein